MTAKPLFSLTGVWMLGVLALSGCSGSNDDLAQWMVQQRNSTQPRVEPVSEPKTFVPKEYTSATEMSPFSDEKLNIYLRNQASMASKSTLLSAELNRRKEPLELMPLDTMTMVGVLNRGNERVALVKVDKLLYQVRKGNYMGQNYGKVVGISDNEMTLREIVQDPSGEWVERPTSLLLQEGTSK